VKPFGPRVFVEPMLVKIENVYFSEGRAQIDSFTSGEMQLSKRDKRSSSKIGAEEENKLL
jgi:hypothetical protein